MTRSKALHRFELSGAVDGDGNILEWPSFDRIAFDVSEDMENVKIDLE